MKRLFPAMKTDEELNQESERDYQRNHILSEEVAEEAAQEDAYHGCMNGDGASFTPETEAVLDSLGYSDEETSWMKGMMDAIDPFQTTPSAVLLAWLHANDYFIPEPHPILATIKKESEK